VNDPVLVTRYFGFPAVTYEDVLAAHGADDFCNDVDNARGDVPVRLDELVPTQWFVDKDYVAQLARAGESSGDIAVAHIGQTLYLVDGHHHAAALVTLGYEFATAAEFFDFDAYRVGEIAA
jgi:hypothetical protein